MDREPEFLDEMVEWSRRTPEFAEMVEAAILRRRGEEPPVSWGPEKAEAVQAAEKLVERYGL